MQLNWRNIGGVLGLILLFVLGPTWLNSARHASPFHVLPQFLRTPEAQSLILLGVVIAVVLLAVKRLR